MQNIILITFVTLCAFVCSVSSYSGPHVCQQGYTCYGRRYTDCGIWGWKRCARSYAKTCYNSVCCAGWQPDGRGGCTTPICDPPCRNGGTCVNPNTCSCTIYYQGTTCWEKKACNGKQIELFLILDSSGSIGRVNFELVKTYARSIVQSLDIGPTRTRVGLMTFSRYPIIRFQLDEYTTKSAMLDAIHDVPYVTGITETYAALTLLQQEGYLRSRSNVPHVAIVITEGTTRHLGETATMAKTLHNAGVTLFAIGVGPDVTSNELHAIASVPVDRHTFKVDNYQQLPSTLLDLATLTCDVAPHSYSVQTTPSPVLITHARPRPSPECTGKIADVMFVLDSSSDVGKAHFERVEHFVIDIINDLDIGENTTQVGVITFNTYPVVREKLSDDKLHLLNAVNQIPYFSGTRETDRALDLLRLEGYDVDRYTAPNIAIIITNGASTNTFLTKREADSVKQNDMEVFVVGVGPNVNKEELQYMATSPEHVTLVPNFVEFDLSNFEFEVARNVCDTIQIITSTSSTTSTTSTTPAPTTIDLSVLSPTNDSCIPEVADVFFLLDSSSSMGVVNFQLVKKYIKHTVEIFDVGLNTTRIGLILYSTDAQIVFGLNQYNNSQDVLDAVDNIKYHPGGTNTGQALQVMREFGFLNDRNVTSKIAFLITDGHSKDTDATRVQAALAKQVDQIVVVVTGIGTHLNFQELDNIATKLPTTNESLIFHVNTYDELQSESPRDMLTRVVCGDGGLTTTKKPVTAPSSATSSTATPPTVTSATPTAQPQTGPLQTPTPPPQTVPSTATSSSATPTTETPPQTTPSSTTLSTPPQTTQSQTTQSLTTPAQTTPLQTPSPQTTPPQTTLSTVTTRQTPPRQTTQSQTTPSQTTPATPSQTTPSVNVSAVPPTAPAHASPTLFSKTTTSPTTTPIYPSTPAMNISGCYDRIDTCIGFGKDVCDDYKPWATANCKHYCGFCEGTTPASKPCEDAIDNCHEYGPYICTTREFLLWSNENCPRYCQMCDPGPVTATTPMTTTTTERPCVNTVPNCIDFGTTMCTDAVYNAWAEEHCREFCGFCSNYVNYPSQKVENTTCPAWRLPKVCKMVQVEGHCCPLPQCPDTYSLTADHPNQH